VNLTGSAMGIHRRVLFVAAYVLVMFEEQLHLRKSKPVMVAAGIIWILVALSYQALGKPDHAHAASDAQPEPSTSNCSSSCSRR
jgi:hypothetical protein